MHYIIMDLEWNNAYVSKTKSFMNEIIEEGKLNKYVFISSIDNTHIVIDENNQNESKYNNDFGEYQNIDVTTETMDILTKLDKYSNTEQGITNLETKNMFRNMVIGWFAKVKSTYNDFIKAMLLDDVDYMEEFMNKIALATFSSFDAGKKTSESTEPEKFYHGFVLGMMVDLRNRFIITSNRESGFGRYDIMLEPKNDEDNAIIIEFKVFKPKKDGTLENTVKNALKQIDDMKYATIFLEKGIPAERIRKYGFAFEGKKVLIGSE